METQDIYFKEYNWYIKVYYNTLPKDSYRIASYLKEVGYSKSIISEVLYELKHSGYNSGMTVSKSSLRHSVVVISKTTLGAEFFNTLIHELNHLSDTIADYWGIPCTGEQISYMIGNVGMMLFPKAGKYLCC